MGHNFMLALAFLQMSYISTIGNISNHKQDFKICRRRRTCLFGRISYTNLQKFPFYDNKIQAPLDL